MSPAFLQIIAVVAVALNVIQLPWQAASIYKKRSGEAVSFAWFASSIGVEAVNIVFGSSQDTPIFVVNAWVCIFGQVLVLILLKKYGTFGRKEKIVIATMSATIIAAIVLPFKAWIQMGATLLNLYGGKDQPGALDRSPGTGALAFWSLALSASSSFLWTLYCFFKYGFTGPIWGYAMYTGYCLFMIGKWLWKSRPAKTS